MALSSARGNPASMRIIEMKTSLSASAVAENQKATAPVELTESETDNVAGGDNGHHYGQRAKELDVPAWSINSGKAADAPGHNK
jgi:hypothetical protein